MGTIDLAAVLDRAKKAVNAGSDSELARYWNKPRTTVSNWRQRGTIPLDELAALALDKCVSLDWLLTGRMSVPEESEAPDAALTRYKEVTGAVMTTMERQKLAAGSGVTTALIDLAFRHRLGIDGIRELVAVFALYGKQQ